jgi:hypothetical protein
VSLPEQPADCSRQNGAFLVWHAVLLARDLSATIYKREAERNRTCNQTVMSGMIDENKAENVDEFGDDW